MPILNPHVRQALDSVLYWQGCLAEFPSWDNPAYSTLVYCHDSALDALQLALTLAGADPIEVSLIDQVAGLGSIR